MTEEAGIGFELERLALEDGDLIVRGCWTGVNGVRFVRPALVVAGDRRILARLEHKPWAPSDDGTWIAAFPWASGATVDADSLVLSVAPQVTVALAGIAAAASAVPPAPAEVAAPVSEAATAPEPELVPKAARAPKAAGRRASRARKAAPASTQPAPAPVAATTATATAPVSASASNGAPASATPVAPEDPRGDELAAALAAAERDRDHALERLDEAVAARETAEFALALAQSERQEVAAQRDEALLAFKTLQRRLQTERAEVDRAVRGEQDADPPPDEPLGVRSVPAVRSVMAELQLAPREPKRRLTRFDLWVVRLLGLAAAACFFLLLFSILRVLV